MKMLVGKNYILKNQIINFPLQSCEMTRVVKNVQKTSGVNKKGDSKCPKEPKTPLSASEKAGSVHDLRRCAVSSLLRVPPQYTTFNERPRPRLPLQVNKAFKDFSSNSKGQKIWKKNCGVCPQFFLKKDENLLRGHLYILKARVFMGFLEPT